MDIEFHYYINYIIALKAGFASETAKKIAHSSQHVDDNTEKYTIFTRSHFEQYTNIVTQSLNPLLTIKDMMDIYPIFHFIPGNEILKSSALRRDGEFRYMTTTPNNKLARLCLRAALKSNDPYWIGIASHAFVDTWAHQNFTGLKDSYNCVDKHQPSNTSFLKLNLPSFIGHANVMGTPDDPTKIWYDYRLKDMKVDNPQRFLDAASHLFKFYIKYGDEKLLVNKPQDPKEEWAKIERFLSPIFRNDIELLETASKSPRSFLILKVLGLKKSSRIDFYRDKIHRLEEERGEFSFAEYTKQGWFESAISETSDSLQIYSNQNNKSSYPVNDNDNQEVLEYALGDSANAEYDAGDITTKLGNMLGINKQLHCWKGYNYKNSDWYGFQEGAKKQHSYMIDKVMKVLQKDLVAMKKANN